MTQRKRATGFALMDTAFAADAKFVRLARKAPNEVAFAACVGVYWLILADARRARSAVVNWEDYTEYTEQIAALKDAKLLTVNGFEGEAFDNWAPAYKAPATVPDRTQPYPTVPNRTDDSGDSEHGAYPNVPDGNGGTQSTVTSTHITSNQVQPTKETRARDDAPQVFMSLRPKATTHMGQHPDCLVCAPLQKQESTG
ncbi:MAG: hypothetical protein LC798_11205 [Chloroflexi bacterium]|nr:hypothetical protein [Chloroflexota bacterium]